MARPIKYEYNGEGFTNKREYRNAIALDMLSKVGKAKCDDVVEVALKKLMDRKGLTKEEAYKHLHVGFFNSQDKKISQELDAVIDQLTKTGTVYLTVFIHVAGGKIVSLGNKILLKKDFSEKGNKYVDSSLHVSFKEMNISDSKPKQDEDIDYGVSINSDISLIDD